MAVTSYYTVNGQIVGEKTTGDSRVDYLTDALGSVTATVDQNAQVVNTNRYKPYGAQLAKTGTNETPRYLWVGGLGYRASAHRFSELYVRARHFGYAHASWLSRDAGVNRQLASYTYADCNPTTLSDASGFDVQAPKAWPGIRIGPVPGIYWCPPGAPAGTTDCNLNDDETATEPGFPGIPPPLIVGQQGKVWILICDQSCTAPCTLLHEQIHQRQLAECCAKAGDCLKQAGSDKKKRDACRSKWKEWRNKNAKAFECEAFRGSVVCLQTLYIVGCLFPPLFCIYLSKQCCSELARAIPDEIRSRDENCKGNPRPTPCPFK